MVEDSSMWRGGGNYRCARTRFGKPSNVMIIPSVSFLVIIILELALKDLRDSPVQTLLLISKIQTEAVLCPNYPLNQQ